MVLVLPISGKSSRFGGVRPKWMLTHPNGNLMLTESIKGLSLDSFNKIVIIALKKHEDTYKFSEILKKEISEQCNIPIDIIHLVLLNKETKSQSETVYLGLSLLNINDSIYIKDCDNYFKLNIDKNTNYNFVSVADLYNTSITKAGNKSYVQTGNNNNVVVIAEKKIIGNLFCSGGYFFKSSLEFIEECRYLQEKFSEDELYISHVIYSMILKGHAFFTEVTSNFIDWGTYEDWITYKNEFMTIFIDLDGVLVKNSSEHFDPKIGSTSKIEANTKKINDLYDNGKTMIIITTARKESFRKITEEQLLKEGIKYHSLLMGLYSAKRVLINDFSKTNTYPSAISINLERDSNNLERYI